MMGVVQWLSFNVGHAKLKKNLFISIFTTLIDQLMVKITLIDWLAVKIAHIDMFC